jgi:hypothetical protein
VQVSTLIAARPFKLGMPIPAQAREAGQERRVGVWTKASWVVPREICGSAAGRIE